MDANQTPREEATAGNVDAIRSEVERLTWALADNAISGADARRLAQLLQEHSTARAEYLRCMQLHAELQQLFGSEETAETQRPEGTACRRSPLLPDMGFSSTGDDARVPHTDGE